jgi:hypothetical protein
MWQYQVKMPLCLIKRHVVKAYGGVDVTLQALLTSALDAGGGQPHLSIISTLTKQPPLSLEYEVNGSREGLNTTVKTNILLLPRIEYRFSGRPARNRLFPLLE